MRVVGGLTAVLGLASAARRDGRSREGMLLGLGSAPVYAAADLHAGRRYSRVYLADLGLQALFAAGWLASTARGRRRD